ASRSVSDPASAQTPASPARGPVSAAAKSVRIYSSSAWLFLLVPLEGARGAILQLQARCHVYATISYRNFNGFAGIAAKFSPEVRTRLRIRSDFPDRRKD